jgi:putative flippase GtrA
MRRFVLYCVVGGLAAALHFLVLIGLVEGYGVLPIKATTVGFCLAVIFNYYVQYYWTFAASGPHAAKILLFSLIAIFALVINTGIFWVCNIVADIPYLPSQVVATGTVVLVNFFLNRRYVFYEELAG